MIDRRLTEDPSLNERKPCPVCGESVNLTAKKCIHCEEFIEKNWLGFKGKTLWDALSLLIIPIVLAGGGILLNISASERQNSINADRARNISLQAYFDKMAEFMLKDEFQSGDSKSVILRSKTITTLQELDARQKGLVLQLLHESALISADPGKRAVVSLRGADLRGADLHGIDLSRVDFFEAKLNGANLQGTNLGGANLRNANLASIEGGKDTDLYDADLTKANLAGADLTGVILHKANLSKANLNGADLSEAVLNEADLSGADLRYAVGLEYILSVAILCNTLISEEKTENRDCGSNSSSAPEDVPIVNISDIVGNYDVSGTNPGDTSGRGYEGTCEVKEDRDTGELRISWTIGKDNWKGIGIETEDGKLYIQYVGEFAGDAMFSLKSDGSVDGTWRGSDQAAEGTEQWEPKPPKK